MKVIKPGRKQEGWSQECVCTGKGNGGGGCGTILLVEQPDLYKTYAFEREGVGEAYNTFKCSECGVETDIQGVPRNLQIPSKDQWLKQRV